MRSKSPYIPLSKGGLRGRYDPSHPPLGKGRSFSHNHSGQSFPFMVSLSNHERMPLIQKQIALICTGLQRLHQLAAPLLNQCLVSVPGQLMRAVDRARYLSSEHAATVGSGHEHPQLKEAAPDPPAAG